MAMALEVDAWAPHLPASTPGSATRVLANHGWKAVTLRPRDRLEVAWQDLGRLGRRQGVGA
jgi:hypothetical protein